jgi:sugar O-acyltransferase (sialic acid O-acetyltransferase NeuD family)
MAPTATQAEHELRSLVIVGAGGHGRETLDVVEAINRVQPTWRVLGFVAEAADGDLLARRGVEHLGDLAVLRGADAEYVIGIGSSETRRRIDEALAGDAVPATLLHPMSTQGSDLRIGRGVIAAAGARITTNVTLGRHTHLNVNAVVSHDAVIGDYVTFSPGVLVNGNATLADGVFLGTGAVVLPGRTIGAWARVGAGAVVTTDVPAGVTAVGTPAHW